MGDVSRRLVPVAVVAAVMLVIPSLAGGEPALPERKPPKMVPDQWHSMSIDSFASGVMTRADCQRYGLRYGYSECNRYRRGQRTTAEQPDRSGSENRAGEADQVAALSEKEAATEPESRIDRALVARRNSRTAEMILVTFDGVQPEDEGVTRVRRLLRDKRIGGVMLRPENIRSSAQVGKLARALRAAQPNGRPLIAFRLPARTALRGILAYPAAGLAAYGGDPEAAFRAHVPIARKLVRLGLDVSVAPRVMPEQHGEPSRRAARNAATFATAFILAHREAGLRVALKADVRPVLYALAGKGHLDAVYRDASSNMDGSADVASLPDNFEGVTITRLPPDLATDASALRRIVQNEAKAGSDLFVLPSSDAAFVREVLPVVRDVLRDGALRPAAMEASVDDILALKRELPLHIVETRQ